MQRQVNCDDWSASRHARRVERIERLHRLSRGIQGRRRRGRRVGSHEEALSPRCFVVVVNSSCARQPTNGGHLAGATLSTLAGA
jgi:hypothetical protein